MIQQIVTIFAAFFSGAIISYGVSAWHWRYRGYVAGCRAGLERQESTINELKVQILTLRILLRKAQEQHEKTQA